MRSLLFVPGDSPRKIEKAVHGPADALILDLEDSVSASNKTAARQIVRKALDQDRKQRCYVRINSLDTDLALTDLTAVIAGGPDGIVLPKCETAMDVDRLSCWLDAFEATTGIPPGRTRIIAIATENAKSVFGLRSYDRANSRLEGLMWGAEDLSASIGASQNRDGGYHSPYRLVRDLCLLAAASAGLLAIDAVNTNISDLTGLREEAMAAYRDGFGAKAVIHPNHVDIINAAFAPTRLQLDEARRLLASFDNPGSGVHTLDGKMVDKPHLEAARRVLERGKVSDGWARSADE